MSSSLPFSLSITGSRMARLTGVRAIMKDIIETLRSAGTRKFYNLSAGNPIILPEVESAWRELTRELLDSPEYGQVVCRYGGSQGYEPLIEAIISDFNTRYGLSLTYRNVLITPGSQALYFYAANAYGGRDTSGDLRKILLPLCPDYTGYGGVSLIAEAVHSCKPHLDIYKERHAFKYRPDFSALSMGRDTGCVIFSRPSNPTGNVLTDTEVKEIAHRAAAVHAPVFIDSAYGPPFPGIVFTEMTPYFADNVVHCMSLSKAGLPGERLGIAIGAPDIMENLECFQSNSCIHSPRYGQAIVARALRNGILEDLSKRVIMPFYRNKFAVLQSSFETYMPKDIPWYLHEGEGALFGWLWLDALPISDTELYQKLKARNVVAVPGGAFFPGLREEWIHTTQCLRISLTAPDEDIREGIKILGEVVREVY